MTWDSRSMKSSVAGPGDSGPTFRCFPVSHNFLLNGSGKYSQDFPKNEGTAFENCCLHGNKSHKGRFLWSKTHLYFTFTRFYVEWFLLCSLGRYSADFCHTKDVFLNWFTGMAEREWERDRKKKRWVMWFQSTGSLQTSRVGPDWARSLKFDQAPTWVAATQSPDASWSVHQQECRLEMELIFWYRMQRLCQCPPTTQKTSVFVCYTLGILGWVLCYHACFSKSADMSSMNFFG